MLSGPDERIELVVDFVKRFRGIVEKFGVGVRTFLDKQFIDKYDQINSVLFVSGLFIRSIFSFLFDEIVPLDFRSKIFEENDETHLSRAELFVEFFLRR